MVFYYAVWPPILLTDSAKVNRILVSRTLLYGRDNKPHQIIVLNDLIGKKCISPLSLFCFDLFAIVITMPTIHCNLFVFFCFLDTKSYAKYLITLATLSASLHSYDKLFCYTNLFRFL